MPPDMRDAIAWYLAYTGGQMPQGGMPGMGGGMGMPGGPSWGPPAEGQPINPATGVPYPGNVDPMPPPPIPNTPGMPDDTIPSGGLPGMPPVDIPNTPDIDPGFNPATGGLPKEPPVNTPMQAPGGPQVAGMDPAAWYRMYTGGMGGGGGFTGGIGGFG